MQRGVCFPRDMIGCCVWAIKHGSKGGVVEGQVVARVSRSVACRLLPHTCSKSSVHILGPRSDAASALPLGRKTLFGIM